MGALKIGRSGVARGSTARAPQPQCRRDGDETTTQWSRDRNLAWRVELPGAAASTPIVWGDRIFLTSTVDESDALLLMSFDRSGRLEWSREIDRANSDKLPQRLAHETSPASPSPATDGEYVWALFGTHTLVKVDLGGNEIWRVDLASRYGRVNNYFGLSMSPLLIENRLFLQLLHTDSQLVVALDAVSYASPTAFNSTSGRAPQILIQGADYITAHRFGDGAEVWRYGTLNPADNYDPTLRLVATPIAVEGTVIVPTAKRGPVFALRPEGFEGTIAHESAEIVWELDRGTPDVPSPLVFGGLVYLSGEKGRLTTLDFASGEVIYEERVHQSTHRASPVHADGKIFLTATDGTVTVVRPGREFEVLAKNDLGEYIAASPAIADKTIYLRTYEALYAFTRDDVGAATAP
ncbi:MAG: PQQ-binding-like beta-propeller repeat protein [Acidobacteriota bacterium]